MVAQTRLDDSPNPGLPKRSRRIENQPLAKIASSKRAEVILMQKFGAVLPESQLQPTSKKAATEYFDDPLSKVRLSAAKELFPSLRCSGNLLQAQAAY